MNHYLRQTTSAAPLAVFRIVLGVLIFAGIVRFWAKGWIAELYIEPKHYFPFYGFEFVKPLGQYTYVLFAACAVFALMFAIGWFYRVAAAGLFLSFTYIELIDKSTYLNHYYFISMICLMMVFLPAHVMFSADASRRNDLRTGFVPRWCVDVLKAFVCIVYWHAGLAKLNSDWLLHAMPLRLWLPASNDVFLIGPLLDQPITAFVFSWAGCLYDLAIPFLLLNRTTRLPAYGAVVIFHLMTAILFPIGMFPYIMIATALIFFSPAFHLRLLSIATAPDTSNAFRAPGRRATILPLLFSVFLILQAAAPLRHTAYPGELLWTEEGYRFSWRVMLMEKAGLAQFTVRDAHGRQALVDNAAFLTPLQEKMMSTQPDMILQYAHILRDHYTASGFDSPEVYVDSHVTLNGRLGRPLVDGEINLALEEESLRHKSWILPIENDIKGL